METSLPKAAAKRNIEAMFVTLETSCSPLFRITSSVTHRSQTRGCLYRKTHPALHTWNETIKVKKGFKRNIVGQGIPYPSRDVAGKSFSLAEHSAHGRNLGDGLLPVISHDATRYHSSRKSVRVFYGKTRPGRETMQLKR